MIIKKTPAGKWAIVADGVVISEHETNAEAWRALDKLQNQPINKREETVDWSFRRGALGD